MGRTGDARIPRYAGAGAILILFLLLLLLVCEDGRYVSLPFRITPLTGDRADLRRFEGQWVDSGGALVVIVSGGTEPRLRIRLPLEPIYSIESARWQDGDLVFDVFMGDGTEPIHLMLHGVDEDRIFLGFFEPASTIPPPVMCYTSTFIRPTNLMREPSPLWYVKQAALRAIGSARDTCESIVHATFDWLAQRL